MYDRIRNYESDPVREFADFAEKASPLNAASREVGEEIDALRGRIEDLTQRLFPLLRPTEPDVEAVEKLAEVRRVVSPYVNDLQGIGRAIERISRTVGELLDRLDV